MTIDNTEKPEEEKSKDLIASEAVQPETKGGSIKKKIIIPPKKIVMGQSSNN